MFLDLEAGSKPTVARQSAKGVSNKELAKLDLASLGIIPRWFCSRLTLYVMNAALERGESYSEIRYFDAWEARILQPGTGYVEGQALKHKYEQAKWTPDDEREKPTA